MIRKPQSPIQQILARLNERQFILSTNCSIYDSDEYSFGKEHFNGPLLPQFQNTVQYFKIQTSKMLLTLSNKK